MPKVYSIFERKEILPYLKARNLLKQYTKAKQYLLKDNTFQVKFKEKNPKGSGIWYFRINKQFRALGVFDKSGDLIIFKLIITSSSSFLQNKF